LLDSLAPRDDVVVHGYAVSRSGRTTLPEVLPAGVRAATSPVPARAAHWLWRHASWPTIEHWSGPVDVVHATNFVAPPARAPVVVTIHDLAFAHSPELCRPETLEYDALVRRAIDRGATVHTVSDHVKEEVVDHYGLAEDRVVRVYLGIDPTSGGGDPERGRALAGSPRYLLALSTVEPRKNYPGLVRAFGVAAAADPDLTLVIAGARGWGADALDAALAASSAASRVRVLGYVSDDHRADLLAGALALAYPSLYEGFGHPPFEAMAAGIPVLAGRAGSLPEVVADAALLVDPRDDEALADGLVRIASDDALRSTLRARGRERVGDFPWSRATDELVALYHRARG
jgi:glycosyltransferase involved in cell wall biosynthesis